MPQKENGYTPIANEIMDALCHTRIAGEQRQILDCILRKTYGWNKKVDEISLSQFMKMTGMSKPHIVRALNKLNGKKFIIKRTIQKDNHIACSYEFNKNYTE